MVTNIVDSLLNTTLIVNGGIHLYWVDNEASIHLFCH